MTFLSEMITLSDLLSICDATFQYNTDILPSQLLNFNRYLTSAVIRFCVNYYTSLLLLSVRCNLMLKGVGLPLSE